MNQNQRCDQYECVRRVHVIYRYKERVQSQILPALIGMTGVCDVHDEKIGALIEKRYELIERTCR